MKCNITNCEFYNFCRKTLNIDKNNKLYVIPVLKTNLSKLPDECSVKKILQGKI